MTTNFANLPAATLISICDYLRGDGHGLYDPKFLTKLGVPQEYVDEVTQTYESDGTHKGSIYAPNTPGIPGDEVIPEMTAVYSLSLYRRIGRDLGLPGSNMMGRGFEAQDLHRRIREHLVGVKSI
jgi:hypothetical protein